MHPAASKLDLKIVGVFVLACLVMGVHLRERLYVSQIRSFDANTYYIMASTPELVPVDAPFAHRWLPHKLIAFVPLEAKRVYELLTWACLLATSCLLYVLLVRTRLPTVYVVGMVVLFFLWGRWGGRFYVWYRAATDPLAYLIIVGGFCAAYARNLPVLALLCAVGAACREHTFWLCPFYYLLQHGLRWAPRGAFRVAAAMLPSIAVAGFVHWVTPTLSNLSSPDRLAQHVVRNFGSITGFATVLVCFATHLGLGVSVLICFPKRTVRRLWSSPHLLLWIAATIGMALTCGGDSDRLMFYAFPAELLLLGCVLHDAGVGGDLKSAPFLIAAAFGQTVISQTFSQVVFPANVAAWWNGATWAVWTVLLIALRLSQLKRV